MLHPVSESFSVLFHIVPGPDWSTIKCCNTCSRSPSNMFLPYTAASGAMMYFYNNSEKVSSFQWGKTHLLDWIVTAYSLTNVLCILLEHGVNQWLCWLLESTTGNTVWDCHPNSLLQMPSSSWDIFQRSTTQPGDTTSSLHNTSGISEVRPLIFIQNFLVVCSFRVELGAPHSSSQVQENGLTQGSGLRIRSLCANDMYFLQHMCCWHWQ